MSIIETLTEGMVNRNMETEGAALLNKWTQTGLLEGLDGAKAQNMAVLLENQAKQLLKESSSMGAGDVAGFAAVAFPIVRRVFAGLIANDLVSVQPMSLPSGLIFFLDFVYSPSLNGSDTQDSRFGNLKNASIYGTNKVGSGVIDGVDLVDARGGDLSQTRGMVGYAYGSPEAVGLAGSVSVTGAVGDIGLKAIITLDGALTDAEKKVLKYDPDLLSKTAGTETVVVFDIADSHFTNPDFDNMSAFALKELQDGTDLASVQGISDGIRLFLDNNGGITPGVITGISQVRRLTQHLEDSTSVITSNAAAVRFFLVDAAGTYTDVINTAATAVGTDALRVEAVRYPAKDTATGGAGDGTIDTFTMLLENNSEIPEIDIKVDSTAITAQTKKLKAKWTPELGQDLNAYHNIDAEVELTSILSEQIALEIDREILADL